MLSAEVLSSITNEQKLRNQKTRQSNFDPIEKRQVTEARWLAEEKKYAEIIPKSGVSNVIVHGTTSGGANFVLCEPAVWNGCLLIYCHGHRPVGHGLVAELDFEGACYQTLLAEGWMIAGTSYRREDVIIKDSQQDVLQLRQYVCARYAAPRLVMLEGQSMGGAISTLMAERYPELIDGVLAVGAALMWRRDKMTDEEEKKINLLKAPLIPILYLTNESEVGPIIQYIKQTEDSKDSGVIRPALWEVSRPGHNWTNQRERLSAIQHLVTWIKFGTFITCRVTNNTHPSLPSLSHPQFDSKGATGKVISITTHNTFVINFTRNDLRTLGIRKKGQEFEFEVSTDNRRFQHLLRYDEYPFVNSRRGDWLATFEPERENILITLHSAQGLLCTARAAGRVMVGDVVYIPRSKKKKRRKVRIPKFLLQQPTKSQKADSNKKQTSTEDGQAEKKQS